MRYSFLLVFVWAIAALPVQAFAQRSAQRDKEFVAAKPAVGDPLPSVEALTPEGQVFSTASLRGHYTALVFGCLT
jgi:hypothetical protein